MNRRWVISKLEHKHQTSFTNMVSTQGLFQLGLVGSLEEGLCGLSEDHIVYLSTDPQSSHAIQAFLSSLTIPATQKHR